jgi:hypothetical protein
VFFVTTTAAVVVTLAVMPSVKHQNSEAGFMTPVAGAASVPPTQVDLAYGGNYL